MLQTYTVRNPACIHYFPAKNWEQLCIEIFYS